MANRFNRRRFLGYGVATATSSLVLKLVQARLTKRLPPQRPPQMPPQTRRPQMRPIPALQSCFLGPLQTAAGISWVMKG